MFMHYFQVKRELFKIAGNGFIFQSECTSSLIKPFDLIFKLEFPK